MLYTAIDVETQSVDTLSAGAPKRSDPASRTKRFSMEHTIVTKNIAFRVSIFGTLMAGMDLPNIFGMDVVLRGI